MSRYRRRPQRVPACLFQPEITPARADGAAVTRLSLAIRIKRFDGK